MISAVIVSWNTRDLTRECLSALYANAAGLLGEVILVDNASADGTQSMVKASFPEVTLVELRENVGFGSANNIAFSIASGESLLLLNTDAFLRPGSLEGLNKAMNCHPTLALVGPRLLNGDGTPQKSVEPFWSHRSEWLQNLGLSGAEPVLGKACNRCGTVPIRSGWVVGACLLVRREVVQAVRGFDSEIFMYSEETDLERRIAALGHTFGFVPGAEVVHLGGASSPHSELRTRRMIVGSEYYVWKHHGWAGLLSARAARTFGALPRAAAWSLLFLASGPLRGTARERIRRHLFVASRILREPPRFPRGVRPDAPPGGAGHTRSVRQRFLALVRAVGAWPRSLPLKERLRGSYRNPWVRTLLHRFGPAVWRLPPELRRRMVPERRWARLRGASIRRFGQVEAVRLAPPVFASGGLNLGQRIVGTRYRLPQPSVMRLPAAWLVGKHATPVTPEGSLLLSPFQDTPSILGLEPNEDILAFLRSGKFREKPEASFREVFPLVSRLDPNYYHWMIESCGQLRGLDAYSEATGIKPRVLIRAGGNPYIRQSLELLGYGPQIIEWPQASPPVFAEGIILASLPGNRVACSPESLRWLREKFLVAAGVDPNNINATRKIYIRRRPGGWRSVANDDEVAKFLEAEGFESTRPEGLALAEQIRLFVEAKVIAGMHGAGLANLLFAPHAAILELAGGYCGGGYMAMASGFGNAYASMCCPARGDDIVVDCDKLLRAIKRLSEESCCK